ncbi:Hypothetical protein SMAX5B_008425 [Scophthalmus maximus]|uniref:Uncharacterized protein n=1 Tax=Scophthalmus maximus TaxID=52904 RepID=A0A2U9B3J3_SCOMX|nr:Hypothetical protein SMAX5B_008425 [Scophthalmus maximus]
MAASAFRRGLWSTVSRYNRKHTHRILSVADGSGGLEAYRQRLQCRACGLPAPQRRFISSRVHSSNLNFGAWLYKEKPVGLLILMVLKEIKSQHDGKGREIGNSMMTARP